MSLLRGNFVVCLLYLIKILLFISDIIKGIGQSELGIILLLFKLCDELVSVVHCVFYVKFSIELHNILEEILEQRLVFVILELMVVDEVFKLCEAQLIVSKVPSII